MHNKKQLYLASQSPRRAQLLEQVGVAFEILPSGVNERPMHDELAKDYVNRLAVAKAKAGWQTMLIKCLPKLPVLGADTTVVLDNEIMGKPENKKHGIAMLSSLSDTTHQVMTSVCLYYNESEEEAGSDFAKEIILSVTNVSEVTFHKLSEQQIESYWRSGEPKGKAGAYAIQGFGAVFVAQLKGSYSSVVGLPLSETYQLLEQIESKLRSGTPP